MRKAFEGGRPQLVYKLTKKQEAAITDYYFFKTEVKTLRDLATKLGLSVQGSSDVGLRVLAQWASEGRICINTDYKEN